MSMLAPLIPAVAISSTHLRPRRWGCAYCLSPKALVEEDTNDRQPFVDRASRQEPAPLPHSGLPAPHALFIDAPFIDETFRWFDAGSGNQFSGADFGTVAPYPIANSYWLEYGGRVGYRLGNKMVLDAFQLGTASARLKRPSTAAPLCATRSEGLHGGGMSARTWLRDSRERVPRAPTCRRS